MQHLALLALSPQAELMHAWGLAEHGAQALHGLVGYSGLTCRPGLERHVGQGVHDTMVDILDRDPIAVVVIPHGEHPPEDAAVLLLEARVAIHQRWGVLIVEQLGI